MASRPSDPSPFPFGVASGDPTTSAVTLWTRHDNGRGWVEWWIDDQAGGERRQGTAESSDGFVHVRVEGLTPGRDLRFGFVANGRHSPEGRTRTLPADPTSVRLAIVCCARWPDGPFELYRRVAETRPDLVIGLGDYIYQDGGGGRRGRHVPDRPCETGEDYQLRYAQYRSDPDLQAAHAAAPWIAVWDDHEFADDAWRFGSRSSESGERWRRRRSAAADAFHSWMPQRPSGNGPTAVDRWLSFGSVADVIAVDCRIAGRERPRNEADGPSSEPDRNRRLLTEDQWDWLDTCVAGASGAHLVLVSSVQFSPLRLLARPRLEWPPLRWVINPDQWDGYPSERRRLLDLLHRHDRLHPLVLSGDLHGRFHGRWSARGVTVREVTTPSITAPTFAELVRGAVGPIPPRLLAAWIRLLNPHYTDLDLTAHAASLVTITEADITVTPIPGPTRRC